MSERPDAQPEALAGTIDRVRNIIENSYSTGGGDLSLRAGDKGIEEYECKGLDGCSRYAYNAIIFPLGGVLRMLKSLKGGLEAWAFKGKRMRYRQGALGTRICSSLVNGVVFSWRDTPCVLIIFHILMSCKSAYVYHQGGYAGMSVYQKLRNWRSCRISCLRRLARK